MASKQADKTEEILKILTLKKEVPEEELEKLAGIPRRKLIHNMRQIENAGLIQAIKTEKGLNRGKQKQKWSLTFLGLLQLLSSDSLTEKEFDQMAQTFKEKWLIFKEWPFLSQDKDVKNLIIINARTYADLKHPLNTAYANKEFATHTRKSKEAQNEFHKFLSQLKQAEATRAALMLEDIFSLGAIPDWIQKHEEEDDEMAKLWKTAIKNQNLLKFIIEQFEIEDTKHNAIKFFQKWLLT